MARKALVDAAGVVVNLIEIEPGADYTPPEGCTLVAPSAGVGPGHTYQNNTFTAPDRATSSFLRERKG
jgi:hypothetical protein